MAFAGGQKYREAVFEVSTESYGVSFTGTAGFYDVSFAKSLPLFATKNAESGEMYQARFAALLAGQEAYNFTVHEGSWAERSGLPHPGRGGALQSGFLV